MKSFCGGSRGPTAWGGEAGAFAPYREPLNGDSQLPVPSIHHSSFIDAPLAVGDIKIKNYDVSIEKRIFFI
jgi:hypothetical protein